MEKEQMMNKELIKAFDEYHKNDEPMSEKELIEKTLKSHTKRIIEKIRGMEKPVDTTMKFQDRDAFVNLVNKGWNNALDEIISIINKV